MIKKVAISIAAVFALLLPLSACSLDTEGFASGGGSSIERVEPENGADYTTAQDSAIRSAQSYLEMSGFSKRGLIQQLSSDAGDGYSRKDATFAVNHIKVNWKKQAVRAGKSYLEMSGFSRQGLIQQLSSDAGDKFTRKQAEYAADKLGL